MAENAWQSIGRVAKARRDRLNLNQEDLADYGGPKVSTVGKFERAVGTFPTRTQNQIEKALGWKRGVIEDYVTSLEDDSLDPDVIDDWEDSLINDDLPDLDSAAMATEFERRVETLRGVLALIPSEAQDEAARAGAKAMLDHATPKLSVVPDRKVTSVNAAHDEAEPIGRGQGHDDNP